MKNYNRSCNSPSKIWLLLICLLITFSINGCRGLLKASPASNAGFIPNPELLEKDPKNLPFHGVWLGDSYKMRKTLMTHTKIIIDPINIEYIEKKINSKNIPPKFKKERIEEAKEVAAYMRQKFIDEINAKANGVLEIVETPEASAVRLQIAIVELTPTNAVTNLLGTTASFFLPGIGILKRAAKGSVAFEALIKDAETNEIMAAFKDRVTDKLSPISVKDFSQYAHTREAIDEWAEAFAKLLTAPLDTQIDTASLITLLPF
ncbi:MAG TPA: DUF3313 family protein [Oligoflexia bacterium]|nr:DUF3313 family protein [Oligoflexia bacterium]HMP27540.1 DUF3313 family protein [Oligoflexia bacterium]